MIYEETLKLITNYSLKFHRLQTTFLNDINILFPPVLNSVRQLLMLHLNYQSSPESCYPVHFSVYVEINSPLHCRKLDVNYHKMGVNCRKLGVNNCRKMSLRLWCTADRSSQTNSVAKLDIN